MKTDILNYVAELTETSWSPTAEELLSENRNPPELVITFFTQLLKDKEHSALRSSNIQRLIDSFAADMFHGVTRGKTITAKHFLLALGLHNLTG